jgi:hypothetical protein
LQVLLTPQVLGAVASQAAPRQRPPSAQSQSKLHALPGVEPPTQSVAFEHLAPSSQASPGSSALLPQRPGVTCRQVEARKA